jgi:hypothetical protein
LLGTFRCVGQHPVKKSSILVLHGLLLNNVEVLIYHHLSYPSICVTLHILIFELSHQKIKMNIGVFTIRWFCSKNRNLYNVGQNPKKTEDNPCVAWHKLQIGLLDVQCVFLHGRCVSWLPAKRLSLLVLHGLLLNDVKMLMYHHLSYPPICVTLHTFIIKIGLNIYTLVSLTSGSVIPKTGICTMLIKILERTEDTSSLYLYINFGLDTFMCHLWFTHKMCWLPTRRSFTLVLHGLLLNDVEMLIYDYLSCLSMCVTLHILILKIGPNICIPWCL